VTTRTPGYRALAIVDHLGVDVLWGAKHAQPQLRARNRFDNAFDARLAPLDLLGRHGNPVRIRLYFFLPSLRKMRSSEYFTPLPL
jgi:hypothetical protein